MGHKKVKSMGHKKVKSMGHKKQPQRNPMNKTSGESE